MTARSRDETRDESKALLARLFRAGVKAALPDRMVADALRALDRPPTILLAAGKSAVEMADAALKAGVRPRTGLVVAREGQGRSLPGLEAVEAAHPTPDQRSLVAAQRMIALAKRADADDHVLVLLSGGASALLCLPGENLTLEGKQALTRALVRSGAPIQEINAVRRHLSAIKGGRLALAASPAQVTTLAISDVVGDAPEAIGSGPTSADPTSLDQAKAILARYGVADPGAGWSESVKPGDPRLARTSFQVIASARQSLEALHKAAETAGFIPISLGDELEGEAATVGTEHAERARDFARRCIETGERLALISGGELTVTVKGQGRGGPNFDYAAALALGLGEIGPPVEIAALAGDSDGIDGNSGASGAFVFGDTAARAEAMGRPLGAALRESDTAGAFAALGDVFAPGPTGTNVNDLRVILLSPAIARR
jgi:hydroxypyruvate reductase